MNKKPLVKTMLNLAAVSSLLLWSCSDDPASPGEEESSSSTEELSSTENLSGEEGSSSSEEGGGEESPISITGFALDQGSSGMWGNPIRGTVEADEDIQNITIRLEDTEGSEVRAGVDLSYTAWTTMSASLSASGLGHTRVVFSAESAEDDNYSLEAALDLGTSVCIGDYNLIADVATANAALSDTAAFTYEDGLECK
jgi:hypothetical protein